MILKYANIQPYKRRYVRDQKIEHWSSTYFIRKIKYFLRDTKRKEDKFKQHNLPRTTVPIRM